jgi:hypothetical protein
VTFISRALWKTDFEWKYLHLFKKDKAYLQCAYFRKVKISLRRYDNEKVMDIRDGIYIWAMEKYCRRIQRIPVACELILLRVRIGKNDFCLAAVHYKNLSRTSLVKVVFFF